MKRRKLQKAFGPDSTIGQTYYIASFVLNTPFPVQSVKLSNFDHVQYLDERPIEVLSNQRSFGFPPFPALPGWVKFVRSWGIIVPNKMVVKTTRQNLINFHKMLI